MPEREASLVSITINGVDVTQYVLFRESSFEVAGSATPGSFSLSLKDPARVLGPFITGHEVQLFVDGVLLWGGLLMNIGRRHFFPAVNTAVLESVTSRKWALSGPDYNIWFDKRVLRNPADYRARLTMPGGQRVGAAVREALPRVIDVPPGVDLLTEVDDTNTRHPDTGSLLLAQGSTWREQMDDFSQFAGAVYYIAPDKKLHFHDFEDVDLPWVFVDHAPNRVSSIGFREADINQDGLSMVTDALIWGGSNMPGVTSGTEASTEGVLFARYPFAPPDQRIFSFPGEESIIFTVEEEQLALDNQALYGRWQRAEKHAGQAEYLLQDSVDLRAHTVIAGPPGLDAKGVGGALSVPLWQIRLTWFAHDVPGTPPRHVQPGDLVPMIFYTMGASIEDPLVITLPCRRIRTSFPGLDPQGKAYVRFDGEFGISAADSRYLWAALLRRERLASQVVATANNSSSVTVSGGKGTFFPINQPDGIAREFELPFPYLAGSTEVFLNGLLQRPNIEYTEIDPAAGTFRFYTAPHQDDAVFVITRTAAA